MKRWREKINEKDGQYQFHIPQEVPLWEQIPICQKRFPLLWVVKSVTVDQRKLIPCAYLELVQNPWSDSKRASSASNKESSDCNCGEGRQKPSKIPSKIKSDYRNLTKRSEKSHIKRLEGKKLFLFETKIVQIRHGECHNQPRSQSRH